MINELDDIIEKLIRLKWRLMKPGAFIVPEGSVKGVDARSIGPGAIFIVSEGQDSGSGEIVP